MTDTELALGMTWFIAVGAGWTLLVLLPRIRRLRARYGWPPPQAPMSDQLRLIAWIVAGAVAYTALVIGMVLWQPVVAFAAGPLVFYALMTAILSRTERQVADAAKRDAAGGG